MSGLGLPCAPAQRYLEIGSSSTRRTFWNTLNEMDYAPTCSALRQFESSVKSVSAGCRFLHLGNSPRGCSSAQGEARRRAVDSDVGYRYSEFVCWCGPGGFGYEMAIRSPSVAANLG